MRKPTLPRPQMPVKPAPKHFDKYTCVMEITGGIPGAWLTTDTGDTLMTDVAGTLLLAK